MSKKQPITYSYPKEIAKEYHQLMSSKESFLRPENLTRAEAHELRTLYERLENVWNLNSTEKLNNQLEENSIELRKIQKEIESDCSTYKKDTEKKLRENLNWKKEHLEQRKKDLTESEKNFEEKLMTWKQDILQREKDLKLHKENINQNASQRLKDLKDTWTNWEQKEPLLKSKAKNLEDMKESLSDELETKRHEYRNLQEKKERLSIKLRESERNFHQKMSKLKTKLEKNLKNEEEASKKKLENLQKELDENLKNLEEKQLRLLKEEIAAENHESTEELRNWFIMEQFYYLSAKDKLVNERSNELKNYMIRELTKIGMELDDFLALIEKHDK